MTTSEDKHQGVEERIDAFFRGEMSEQEQTLFLADMKSDPELRRRAEISARLVRGMAVVGRGRDEALRDSMERMSAGDVSKVAERTVDGKRKRSVMAWSVGVAAAVALAVVGLRIWYVAPEDVHPDYSLLYCKADVYAYVSQKYVRGDLTDVPDFELICAQMDSAKTLSPQSLQALADMFDASCNDTYNVYTSRNVEIGWRLVVAYVRDGKDDKAVEVLTRMSEMYPQGTAVGDDVREVIKSLTLR